VRLEDQRVQGPKRPTKDGGAPREEFPERQGSRLFFVDPEELRRREERRKWIDGVAFFLSRFRWDVYATLSFKWEVSEAYAERKVREFLQWFGPQVYAYVTLERGSAGGHAASLATKQR
jgi:hypothetical protein